MDSSLVAVTITNVFQKILKESNCKSNKIWIDKGSEFYNISMKSFLQNNNIELFSTHNERKLVVAEISIKTLKNEIYKYMTSISENVHIDKLGEITTDLRQTDLIGLLKFLIALM